MSDGEIEGCGVFGKGERFSGWFFEFLWRRAERVLFYIIFLVVRR